MQNVMTAELRDVALSYMEGLDCARSLSVAILIRYSEWGELQALQPEPSFHLSADSYFRDACASEFLRKFTGFEESKSVLDATLKKWFWAEHQCYRTNERLSMVLDDGNDPLFNPRIAQIFELTRKRILSWIDGGPDDSLAGRFGPGATVSDKSSRTTVLEKMSSVPSMTPDCWRVLPLWSSTKWRAAVGDEISLVRGNFHFTVPKNSSIRRSCGKEPSLNVFFQLALGKALRARLKRQGLDLDFGQSVHREVARHGSIHGNFATIDLSSASDCVSSSLVRRLIPHGWLKYLESTRSPLTSVNKVWHHLEKYSSMGNGYTFELETLLFAALISVALDEMGFPSKPGRDFFVYGDDIIVETGAAQGVLALLKFAGFTPNQKKTFFDGYFRESCGGDFFKGVAVRPYYLTEDPDEPQKVFSLANGIRRASQEASDGLVDPRFLRCWFRCLDLLPSHLKTLRGPESLGDLVIHDERSKWSIRWRSGIKYVKVYRPARYRKVKWGWFQPDVQFAAALYGVQLKRLDRLLEPSGFLRTLSETGAYIVPRDGVSGYKVGWVAYS